MSELSVQRVTGVTEFTASSNATLGNVTATSITATSNGTFGNVTATSITATSNGTFGNVTATSITTTSNGTFGNVSTTRISATSINTTSNGTFGNVTATSINATAFVGDGSGLTGITAASFPAGTAMLFIQTAAPTGWTKSTTHNNKALRIVSGAASSGGTVAFTTAFASQAVDGTVGGTTLTTTTTPAHRHFTFATGTVSTLSASNQPVQSYSAGCSSPSDYNIQGTTTDSTVGRTSSVGSGSSHTHSFTGTAIDLAVQYVDAIIATKD